jgi:hypothetical protein
MYSILRRGAAILAVAIPCAAQAVTVTINSPTNGLSVTPGQVVGVSVSFSGSFFGVQSVTIHGDNDADGFDDTFNYNPSPPKLSGTVSGSYKVPASVTNGQHFTITATVQDWVDGPFSNSVDVIASVAAAPSNDDFANAITITGASGSITGSNVSATKQSGEPNHGGATGGSSVWWQWTAPAAGNTTIDTIGSGFDTLLGVYTGSAVGSLTTIAGDDQGGGNNTSLVTFSAVAGTTYYIAVDGFFSDTGAVKLNWVQGGDAVVNLGYYVIDAVYSQAKDRLYLVNSSGSRIDVVDPAAGAIIGNLALPAAPNCVAVSPDGLKLSCAMSSAQQLRIYDLNTSTVIADKSTSAIVGSYNPQFMCWGDNDKLFIGMGGSGSGFGGTTRPLKYVLSTDSLTVVTNVHSNAITSAPTDPYFMKMSATGNIFLCDIGISPSYLYTLDNNCSGTGLTVIPNSMRTIDASPTQDQYLHLQTGGPLTIMNNTFGTLGTITGSDAAVFGGGRDYVLTLQSTYPSPVPLNVYNTNGALLASKTTNINSFDVFGGWTRLYRGKSNAGGPQTVFAINNSQTKLYVLQVPQVITAADADWSTVE